uniref:ReO_6 family protein n=1 Tax=Rhipicephalus appendiculatus TaxID=34631 RepID=A0A131YMY1_RHIAP
MYAALRSPRTVFLDTSRRPVEPSKEVSVVFDAAHGLKLLRNLLGDKKVRLSQDHLEMFFSCVRHRGGWNNNPSAMQFRYAYRSLLIHGNVAPVAKAPVRTFPRKGEWRKAAVMCSLESQGFRSCRLDEAFRVASRC